MKRQEPFRPEDASPAALFSALFDGWNSCHMAIRTSIEGMSSEVLLREPRGGGNTIGATFIHALSIEDHYIQTAIQGKVHVWDSGGWGERLGITLAPTWSSPPTLDFDFEGFGGYADAVLDATTAYIASLTADEVNRRIPGPGASAAMWSMTVSELLVLVAGHGFSHTGEISAVAGALRQPA